MSIVPEKIGFDDILLVPRYSDLHSRTEPDLSVSLGSEEYNIQLKTPLISSPMDSITGPNMLSAMHAVGGLGILSRYISLSLHMEIDRQSLELRTAIFDGDAQNVGCAVGIHSSVEKTKRLLEAGCRVICVDVAHCDHSLAHRAIESVAKYRSDENVHFVLMAGNVCTRNATRSLIGLGVDAIKVGVGPGAVCTTRKVTGFGVPQLSAIMDCSDTIKESKTKVSLIADGGIRTTGDMVKSLWAGADACMLGYMLAGTDCTPDIDGKKMYRGMSSRTVSRRDDVASEGINVEMGYQGGTIEKLTEYIQGIKSGLAMGGCKNISDLRNYIECVRLSNAAMKESLTL